MSDVRGRLAPSPTGLAHLGNAWSFFLSWLAVRSVGGELVFRMEDLDLERSSPVFMQALMSDIRWLGLDWDEGPTPEKEDPSYHQSNRYPLYTAKLEQLKSMNLAYPCFCTEEELAQMRRVQEANKENPGYYGKYAKCRNLTMEEIEENLKNGKSYVIRFRSSGSIDHKIKFTDLVKGQMEITENDQDVVILKSDGLPTYHFAHVIDDHLMHTTHVVRGEEWLSTLPIHLQLFSALGFKPPKYAHTAQLMKMDGTSRRKLSKRKDPEFALDYYFQTGVPIEGAKEYLMTLLNSNFEEWRRANPNADLNDFPFSTKKMGSSGALYDLDKLNDVCKNVVSRMSADQVYEKTVDWARQYDPDFAALLTGNEAYAKSILAIGRGGKKPRKDFGRYSEVKEYISFFFDDLFRPDYSQMPQNVDKKTASAILRDYAAKDKLEEDNSSWFEAIKAMCPSYGFTADTKAYKKDPSAYKGSVGDLSMILRVAVCGRSQAPDLFTVMQLLGFDKVKERLVRAAGLLDSGSADIL